MVAIISHTENMFLYNFQLTSLGLHKANQFLISSLLIIAILERNTKYSGKEYKVLW